MSKYPEFERFRGKRGLVMGLGVFGGGVESAKFLSKYCSTVLVTDLRDDAVLADSIAELKGLPIEFRLHEHSEQDFIDADIVIHSPAVRPDNKFLKIARENGAEVTMEMSLFIEVCPAKTIGITGSNGKTTTALLAYEMLCEVYERAQPELEGRWAAHVCDDIEAHCKVWLGGNCGQPLLNRLEEIGSFDVVILELSSFQLQDWHRIECSCKVSVITNITPNHLDWHKDMAEYEWAKTAVFAYGQGNTIFLNAEGSGLQGISSELNKNEIDFNWVNTGVTVEYSDRQGDTQVLVDPYAFQLPGEFNWQNFHCAAAVVAEVISAAEPMEMFYADYHEGPMSRCLDGAFRFRGVEHRLEYCGQINGARCFNDSIATTPESTLAALSAFDSGIHLLLGGSVKGLSFAELTETIANHQGIKHVYVQGANASAIKSALRDGTPFSEFDSFDAACEAAFRVVEPDDVFLMSPSSASFYEYSTGKRFTNFEHRGEYFKELVKAQPTFEQ